MREPFDIGKERKVDDLEGIDVAGDADDGKDRRHGVARENADDEWDHAQHLFAVYRAGDGHAQGDQPAQQRQIRGAGHLARSVQYLARHQVSDGVGGERKADDGDRRPDDRCGHHLIDPLDADQLDDDGDDHIHQPRKDRADDEAEIAQRRRYAARECRRHRADEGEGTAQKYGAFELCEQQVHDGARACAEQRRRNGHAVADDHRHGDGRRQDRQQLLQSEEDELPRFGPVFHAIDKLHW